MALWLLSVAAAIEAATGLALIIYPQAVASLRRKCADRRPMPQISLDDFSKDFGLGQGATA